MELQLSSHAQHRQRNRAIPLDVIDHVTTFGRERHHAGAVVVEMDRKSRQSLRRYLGDEGYQAIEEHLDVYVVLGSAGKIVTVGHRLKSGREGASRRFSPVGRTSRTGLTRRAA
ncbi:hypothetical protein [Bosea sp. RAC05]|uniref:hypothetical protein n=1 Tax=Bosea sp. RAC05 TaxID=1842539 RepID=UPI00083E2A0E|nr:hypothetical protein [Bosea sp. RAC05]AOG03451.1 hypothetical protein BSY19_4845 [Bosea sp. RAC05]